MRKPYGPRYARRAFLAGVYKGRKVYRIPVVVRFNNSRAMQTVAAVEVEVLSYSATDAANYIRDEVATRPETEVIAFGPRGGKVERFVGWESAIYAQMVARTVPETGLLF